MVRPASSWADHILTRTNELTSYAFASSGPFDLDEQAATIAHHVVVSSSRAGLAARRFDRSRAGHARTVRYSLRAVQKRSRVAPALPDHSRHPDGLGGPRARTSQATPGRRRGPRQADR